MSSYQVSASVSVLSLQRAIARRVPREPGGRASKRTTSVTIAGVGGAHRSDSERIDGGLLSAGMRELWGRVWSVLLGQGARSSVARIAS
jgi:hypothetical protein